MYESFFGLKELPFSIAPDPRYLYMSERHREALAHLLFGTGRDGGFVLLTGEVGTGKTTVCRRFLQRLPDNTDVAFIVHPRLTARELLATICDELAIQVRQGASVKTLIDAINDHLLSMHARGRHVVLIIDEAQNLSTDVLEQLRLLTNLETDTRKLLQIILLGQPELLDMLGRPELRQLAQRITARYHLSALSQQEVEAYIRYRLGIAGCRLRVFTPSAVRRVYRHTRGIPRLINLLCDRALLGAYGEASHQVTPAIVNTAARELGLASIARGLHDWHRNWFVRGVAGGVLAGLLMWVLIFGWVEKPQEVAPAANVAGPVPEVAVETESVPIARHALDWGAQLNAFRGDRREAYLSLFKRWRLTMPDASEEFLCRSVQVQGMECLHQRGSWSTLMRLNRPAVIPLLAADGKERYAALLAVQGDKATLSVDGQTLDIPVEAVRARWDGQFTLLWRVPPFRSAVIRPGEVRDEKLWLSGRLMKAGYTQAEQDLNAAIRRLQTDSGLKADGIAGAMTLIRLNTLTEPDVPRLVE